MAKRSLILLSALGALGLATGALAQVAISAGVQPGVYGQVTVGERPPPLVYEQPQIVEEAPDAGAPIYLHVPPEHARDWRHHCSEYNACRRPVYFVRSEEYEPGWRERHEHEHGDHERREHEHDHDRDHDD